MVLIKELMTKSLSKGRLTAVSLVERLARSGGTPVPVYEYEASGTPKRPKHFMKIRFSVPKFLRDEGYFDSGHVVGAGKAGQKAYAKSLAALEAVHRLEEALDLGRGGLQKKLEEYEMQQQTEKEKIEATPVEEQIQGVSWASLPLDHSFADFFPATRKERINFFPELMKNPMALMAAKELTLSSYHELPEIAHHWNRTDDKGIQRFANIRCDSQKYSGQKFMTQENYGIERQDCDIQILEGLAGKLQNTYLADLTDPKSSFGMAKLFTSLPKHQFDDIKNLLNSVEPYKLRKSTMKSNRRRSGHDRKQVSPAVVEDEVRLKERIASFRRHQQSLALPVDSVEDKIPHDAPVTVVRGGTGSGKTSRYPLMLSLLSPSGPSTKVLVVQPRRLACQTAAHRVAFEQDAKIGKGDCPIGYSIRFESFPSKTNSRTVDFQTPGVILRRAMDDPLLSDVTHLVIDEIHERNADMDLLVALAKSVLKQRTNHPTLPPLQLVLMSATLDSSQWESYFRDCGSSSNSVAVLDVPDVRRFPIDIVHLGDSDFPSNAKAFKRLMERPKHGEDADDELLWEGVALLAVDAFASNRMKDGTILCFLPGIEEIRTVDRLITSRLSGRQKPNIVYLHSSLSSKQQAKAFEPGPKIILSTNLAETSVTIPDVKVVIDSGKERQFSLLDSTSDDLTVVGSQLVTTTISRASAKQRAGRAGRVSAGTCYRLFTKKEHDEHFEAFTTPEMLRMDLSSLVLHSLSMYHPESGHSLHALRNTPDPPTETRLSQTLQGLEESGLLCRDLKDDENATLTPLGSVVSSLPASPRIGRMLIMGLALGAIEPALQLAALLSVPKAFQVASRSNFFSKTDQLEDTEHSSDLVKLLEAYQAYLAMDDARKSKHRGKAQFKQVSSVERQLHHAVKSFLGQHRGVELSNSSLSTEWNANGHRLAAQAALICVATPHIAHLVNGKNDFATRDVANYARIHPSSVNASPRRRTHWYLYDQLRTTSMPYLHLTTAASPLELALFSGSSRVQFDSDEDRLDDNKNNYDSRHLYVVDQWVPVQVSKPSQKESFLKLRQLLTCDVLQQLAEDPQSVVTNATYQRIVLYILSAIEQQRMKK